MNDRTAGALRLALAVLAVFAVGAWASAQGVIEDYEPVTNDMLVNPPAEEWLHYRGNYEGWGYSSLDQINRENVGELRLVWSRLMEPGRNESTPQVHDGVMFLATHGDVIQALDAVSGDMIWEYRRDLPDFSELEVHSRYKRNVALHDDELYFVSADNYIVALDATNGQLIWETPRGDPSKVSGPTGPMIAGDVIVTGSSCSTSDIRCYITGHDMETGEELWRFHPVPAPGEEGDDTWANLPLESRMKAGVWHMQMYDPELNLIYFGSNSVGPSSPTARGTGDAALFGTNTRYAMNPDTGEIVWARQIHPMSSWDQECTLEMPLVDITMSPDPDATGMEAINPDFDFSSGPVSAIVGVPCKQGMVWAFERESGEFLWAKNVLEWQNLYSGVDEQGNVQVNEDVLLTEIGQSYRICPQFLGGRNYYPTAFSPLNNTLFVPTSNTCADAVPYTADPSPSEGYAVDSTVVPAPGKTNIGRLDAVSLETGETLWTYERRPARFSPVMASGGGLVFGGNLDGVFEAIDQETGEQLWSTRLPGQISGHTTTFMIDGVQYVAVTTGNSLVSNGFSSLTPEVDTRAGANAVFVFALPQD